MALDGGEPGDGTSEVLPKLVQAARQRGDDLSVVPLRERKLGNCIGCFGCWLKTPGRCVIPDEGRALLEEILGSDELIVLTPVTFGGYSSTLKRMIDRLLPSILPYFTHLGGELHHRKRNERYPRWVAVGVQAKEDAGEAEIFRLLVTRNALNFHAPSHAAEVLTAGMAGADLAARMRDLLQRSDPTPPHPRLSDAPAPHAPPDAGFGEAPGRALLLVGSSKTHASNSAMLGEQLLAGLTQRRWSTSTLVLKPDLRGAGPQSRLLEACRQADLIVLAFPLYIDSLPCITTLALEVLAKRADEWARGTQKRFVALANNGFPEAHQNVPALAICERFASRCGLHFAGALALGAGEAVVAERPLSATSRSGGPPVFHVVEALDRAAHALAQGGCVPVEANRLLARSPVPFVPFGLWRVMFRLFGGMEWRKRAASHGVARRDMLAKNVPATSSV